MKRRLFSIVAIIAVAFGSQLIVISAASAADSPSDLSVNVATIMQDQLYADIVCNDGPSDVTSLTLSSTFTNYDVTFMVVLPNDFNITTATTSGTLNNTTNVWTGLIQSGECVAFGTGGVITGATGETVVHDISIVSSVLGDNTANVDPTPNNNSSHYVSDPIVPVADIAISTRLKTSGTIQNGSSVDYEVTLTNVGAGAYYEDGATQLPLGLYFLMPLGSNLGDVTDLDTTDGVSINGCGQVGSTSQLGTGAAPYPGVIAGCSFSLSGTFLPGASIKFNVNLTAGTSFASGSTGVWAIALADEPDVMAFQVRRVTTSDMFSEPSNNYVNLVYDNSTLQATVSRCTGQSEVTTDGSGCFRVSFNKDVPEGEFDASDIDLGGKGTISSFTQLGANLWEVRVTGIAQGATLALVLNANSIRDFSYVANITQVLGENTIRFASPDATPAAATETTSASGTLAETGANSLWMYALGFLLLGMFIMRLSRIEGSLRLLPRDRNTEPTR